MLTALDLENKIKKFFPTFTPHLSTEGDEEKGSSFIEVYNEVKEYQLRNNVPAVYFRDLNWEGHTITAPFYSPFLAWDLNDVKVMKEHKDRVLNWFMSLATDKIENEGYLLCQQTFDEDICEVYLPLNVPQFEKTALEFDWVEILYCKDNVVPCYADDTLTTVHHWVKSFEVTLKRGYSLDLFENIADGNSETFSLRKTYLIDPRE
jgi:hypothetical protein